MSKKTDVLADPLSTNMRLWVNRAAAEVISYMNGGPMRDIPYRGPARGSASQPKWLRVKEMHSAGLSDEEIAEALKLSPVTVRAYRQRGARDHRMRPA